MRARRQYSDVRFLAPRRLTMQQATTASAGLSSGPPTRDLPDPDNRITGNEVGWQALRAASSRLSREDLTTLGAFEAAYGALQAADDAPGMLLTVAYAVQAIAAAYADFREAAQWVERLREAQSVLPALH